MRGGAQSSGREQRIDRAALRIDSSRAPEPHFRPDGQLQHVDYYAKISFGDVVQQYDIGAEFRPGEEVCANESVASWRGLVLADEHPEDGVTVDNAASVNRGHILESWAEYPDVCAKIRVNDRGTIEKINAGKQKLSCGYSLQCDEAPGEHNGTPYKRRQKNILGDHVALTFAPRGERAGDNPRLYMDSKGARVGVQKDSIDMKKIQLPDGTEVEVPEAVAAYLEGLQAEKQKLAEELAKLKPEGDPPPADKPAEVPPPADGQGRAPGEAPKMDSKAVVRLIEDKLTEERKRSRADSLAFASFQTEAESVLRRAGKAMVFTGDLVTDRITFAQQILGAEDPEVKRGQAALKRRADSKEPGADSELLGLSIALHRIAVERERLRHDSTPQQIAGLTHHDSSGADDGDVLGTLHRQHSGAAKA